MRKNRFTVAMILFVIFYTYIGIVYLAEQGKGMAEVLSKYGSSGSEDSNKIKELGILYW